MRRGRMKVAVSIAVLGAVLVTVAAVPAVATSGPRELGSSGPLTRAGVIVVRKKISLRFPAPNFYAGKLTNGRAVVKRNSIYKNRRAPRRLIRQARARARARCRKHIVNTVVRIVHAVKPPFLIRPTNVGSKSLRYRTAGVAPPKGDPVRASQAGRKFRRIRTGAFAWLYRCLGARITKPYPF